MCGEKVKQNHIMYVLKEHPTCKVCGGRIDCHVFYDGEYEVFICLDCETIFKKREEVLW